MKNNNKNNKKIANKNQYKNNLEANDYNNINVNLNNINSSEAQHLKNSLRKLKNIYNILKDKNNIIDGMLLSTKKRKKMLAQEKSDKENEIITLENEINIVYNKLFSEYFNEDNNKSIILTKMKLLGRELTQKKYLDYLNKKIMVEQKEEKMQKKLSLLNTEQLEQFNKEIFTRDIYNNKEKEHIELIIKQYEDIKKTEIITKIINEIKESLGGFKSNDSKNSLIDKSKKKFCSKMLNINTSNKGSFTSLNSCSQGNYEMRSEMFSNKAKRKKVYHSVENKNLMSSQNYVNNEDLNVSPTQKYLLNNKNYGPKDYVLNNLMNKKNKKYHSKLFMNNQYM